MDQANPKPEKLKAWTLPPTGDTEEQETRRNVAYTGGEMRI